MQIAFLHAVPLYCFSRYLHVYEHPNCASEKEGAALAATLMSVVGRFAESAMRRRPGPGSQRLVGSNVQSTSARSRGFGLQMPRSGRGMGKRKMRMGKMPLSSLLVGCLSAQCIVPPHGKRRGTPAENSRSTNMDKVRAADLDHRGAASRRAPAILPSRVTSRATLCSATAPVKDAVPYGFGQRCEDWGTRNTRHTSWDGRQLVVVRFPPIHVACPSGPLSRPPMRVARPRAVPVRTAYFWLVRPLNPPICFLGSARPL